MLSMIFFGSCEGLTLWAMALNHRAISSFTSICPFSFLFSSRSFFSHMHQLMKSRLLITVNVHGEKWNHLKVIIALMRFVMKLEFYYGMSSRCCGSEAHKHTQSEQIELNLKLNCRFVI
ncbi:CLUMA_CG018535, isoform A [Clunio marinus]|uniref:CLUMA_CG018535, isoform A n=1 Tax=Clunio marinus TaxID=568069 RepID=A0A1J1IXI8_9DIPT|nr:CLUMA_CG018535, isoform A [Clunio marinus]